MSPTISFEVFFLFLISRFAPINSKTSNNPFLDSFKPTFLIITLEPLEIIVATIIKAADEKSPGTSNEFFGSSSE